MQDLKGVLEYSTFIVLGLMGFVALFLTIERAFFYHFVKISSYEKKELLEIDLTKNLTLISTVAATAPYVGLLGTVFGIMLSFINISSGGMMDTQSIMLGLALALKATALGLFVAIPAMFFYNLLARKAEVLISLWESKN
ncbi:MAG: TonB-system energizer ExbB [Helicobacteraceae bacterium]